MRQPGAAAQRGKGEADEEAKAGTLKSLHSMIQALERSEEKGALTRRQGRILRKLRRRAAKSAATPATTTTTTAAASLGTSAPHYWQ